MKVSTLKKILKKIDDDCEIRIDNDEDGFYLLEAVEIITDSKEDTIINLVSSNEA